MRSVTVAPEPTRAAPRAVLAQPDAAHLTAQHNEPAAGLGRAPAVLSALGQEPSEPEHTDHTDHTEDARLAESTGSTAAELGFGGHWPWLRASKSRDGPADGQGFRSRAGRRDN